MVTALDFNRPYVANTHEDEVRHSQSISSTKTSNITTGVIACGESVYGIVTAIIEVVEGAAEVSANNPLLAKVSSVWQTFSAHLDDVLTGSKYKIVHGSLCIGGSALGIVSGLDTIGAFDLGGALPIINGIASGCFLTASIMSLNNYVEMYRQADASLENATPEQILVANKKKTSAIIGMIACIASIIGSVLSLIGGLATFAFVFGIIAFVIGCIKMIHDYFRSDKLPKPEPAAA